MRRLKTNAVLTVPLLLVGLLSAADNTWEEVKPPQLLPSGRKGTIMGTNWGGITYRPASHSLLLYDRYAGEELPYAIYANAVTAWDLTNNVTRVLKIAETAPVSRHTYEVWTYVESKDAVYTMKGAHQGCGIMENGAEILWKFNFSDNTWRQVTSSTPRSYGCEGKMAHWKTGNRLIYIDGQGKGVHELDLSTEAAWSAVTSTNPPGNFVYGGTSTWDTMRDQWVFYQGKTAELRVYNPRTRVFSNLAPTGSARPPLSNEGDEPHRVGIAYISTTDEYMIASQKTGTWAFEIATRTWRRITNDNVLKLTQNTYIWFDAATSTLYGLGSEPNYRYKMNYRKPGTSVQDRREGRGQGAWKIVPSLGGSLPATGGMDVWTVKGQTLTRDADPRRTSRAAGIRVTRPASRGGAGK